MPKPKPKRPPLTRAQAVDLALRKVRTERFEQGMRRYLQGIDDRRAAHRDHSLQQLPTKKTADDLDA